MSLFGPWRGADGAKGKSDEGDGPITAPGGWSNLLTWRPSQRPNGNRFNSSSPYNTEQGGSRSDARLSHEDREDGDSDEDYLSDEQVPQRLFTAKTRQLGSSSGAARSRAPIPFDLDSSASRAVQQPRRKGKTSSISSFDTAAGIPPSPMRIQPSRFEAHLAQSLQQGVDSADVSAELELAGELSADLSFDGIALDSAFQTLTRIRAKDAAASTGVRPLHSSSSIRATGSSSTISNAATQQQPKKLPPAYRTPNQSPTQPAHGSWMQWGTERIRSTLPRGLASALFAPADEADRSRSAPVGRYSDIDEEDDSFEGDEDQYVPAVVSDCVDVICGRNGGGGLLDIEGLFRIPPSNALLKQARSAYFQGKRPDLRALSQRDPHLPAALLKDYLRSLRPPLIGEDLYDDIQACPPQDADKAIAYVRNNLLPRLSFRRAALLEEVLGCAHIVSQHSKDNRMDPANLAIVITPSLVHGSDVMRDVAICNVPAKDESELKSTLGSVFILCMERYEDLFADEDTDDDSGEDKSTPLSSAWESGAQKVS